MVLDILAKNLYDDDREFITGDALSRRALEFGLGAAVGGIARGGIDTFGIATGRGIQVEGVSSEEAKSILDDAEADEDVTDKSDDGRKNFKIDFTSVSGLPETATVEAANEEEAQETFKTQYKGLYELDGKLDINEEVVQESPTTVESEEPTVGSEITSDTVSPLQNQSEEEIRTEIDSQFGEGAYDSVIRGPQETKAKDPTINVPPRGTPAEGVIVDDFSKAQKKKIQKTIDDLRQGQLEFDAKASSPFFNKFNPEQYEEGRFIDIDTGRDLTDQSFQNMRISIVNGKPVMETSDVPDIDPTTVRSSIKVEGEGYKIMARSIRNKTNPCTRS